MRGHSAGSFGITFASALVFVLLPAGGMAAPAASNASFLLTAQFRDLPTYFPAILGNGYIATLTAPRGIEATDTYLAALMDYTPGDISRPALVPGWTKIDFNSGPSASGAGWLSEAPLTTAHFEGYRQTLDLRQATLTTRYRYVDRGRETAIQVTTLVSEASPHLAATRLAITPDYDGVVRVSFPLTLWAPHTPRFALARLSDPAVQRAVAAHGLSLEPRAPATADRAALWYAGHVEVRTSGGDAGKLTLWLAGRAEHGLSMAMAAAVALPEGVRAKEIALRRDDRHLALDVTLRVERGRTYAFTKYISMSRTGWGGTAADDVALAQGARRSGFSSLLDQHRAAWRALWRSDILIDGDVQAQRMAHSALYYLLASTTADTAWSIGPCGLTPCYAGHVFWDSDTWIFPALLLLHPRRAESLVSFRSRTLAAAQRRARQPGLDGAMFPWESDPENGSDQTPYSSHVLADTEIHVNADVAIAQWQYYLATLNRKWLLTHGWPVIRGVARFLTSRVSYDPREHRYEILHVTSVSESDRDIPNDTFTNMGAASALTIATAAARALGQRPDPRWDRVARGLYIPLAADGQHHLPFDPSVSSPGDKGFGAGPLPLLFLPALDLPMSARLRQGDYEYDYRQSAGSMASVCQVSMGILPWVTAAVEVGQDRSAATWLECYRTGGTLKLPFNVRTETATNYVGPFLTGSGAYLQSLIYGLSGLRIRPSGLVDAYPPVLPPAWGSLTLHGITFRGRRLDIRIARNPKGVVQYAIHRLQD